MDRQFVAALLDRPQVLARLQPDLPHDLGRMDDTSPENVAGLERITREHCARNAAQLDEIAAALQA